NVKKKFRKSAAHEIFLKAALAFTDEQYEEAMDDLEEESQLAAAYVRKPGVEYWARVKETTGRYSLMTTNICESFNGRIKHANHPPVTHLVDFIRRILMEWFSESRQMANEWKHDLSSFANKKLKLLWHLAKTFTPCLVKDDEYEVTEYGYVDVHLVEVVVA
ncbi:hypothetical protein MKW92_016163, partial [Papaver armeniacum]